MSVFTRGLSRLSKRKRKNRALPTVEEAEIATETPPTSFHIHDEQKNSILGRGMDRLRRSIRQSFRKRKSPERIPAAELVAGSSSSRGETWQPDESAVKSGVCSFPVKYLGSIEVYESRGMQVCEGALKMLRNNRRNPIKAILYVSGDGLRVVDQQNQRGLIVDQTIEKVSFCAPDRNNTKGFAYICRDGTSRRWMCHGFHASKDAGERLSHAVGCAFAICLERKKKRDEQTNVVVTAEQALHPDWGSETDPASSSTAPQRVNQAYQSFRKQISISERLQDPQSAIVNTAPEVHRANDSTIAKPRPSANPALFQRQGSLRAPDTSSTAQFRRNLSLRTDSSYSARNPASTTTLFKEPIYEGDEDDLQTLTSYNLNSSNTAPPSTTHSAFDPSSQPSTSNNQYANLSANWNTFDTSGGKPSLSDAALTVNTQWSTSSNPPMSNRSTADEWLEGAMKNSLSFNSPPATAQVTPSPSYTNGFAANGHQSNGTIPNLMDSPITSGPPPQYAPPPLPSKAAVSNGNAAFPSTDAFGQSVNWDARPVAVFPKPEDPFDVQWSRMAVSTTNPFSQQPGSNREVSI